MQKNFLFLFILLLTFTVFGCKSSSKEDTYGWWKPETKSAFNNPSIFISENNFYDNKDHKILKWEKSENGFLLSCDLGTFLIRVDEKGYLIVKPQIAYAGELIYSRTTEEVVRKTKEEQEQKRKKLTTSTSDPF